MGYFTNPYNFVPLDGECKRSSSALGAAECLTGFFQCELELLTPLFVPNTSNSKALCNLQEREKGYSGYEFSSYADLSGKNLQESELDGPPKEPVIMGSEIRGPVRSVYEAAFNGCMSTMRTDLPLGRRSPQPKKPGILEKCKDQNGEENWRLFPCKRAMLNVFKKSGGRQGTGRTQTRSDFGKPMCLETYGDRKEGEEIWIRLSKEGYQTNGRHLKVKVVEDFCIPDGKKEKPDGFITGWIHKGEPFGNKKHHESVFYGEDREHKREVSKEDYHALKRVIEDYQQGGKMYPEYSAEEDRVLVYFSDDKNAPLYLSPACIGKESYYKTFRMILERNGGYQPCEDASQLCSACKVFGMVAQGKEDHGAVGSRVRFTDALLEKGAEDADQTKYYCEKFVLPEAGEPHPAAVEFYTESPYRGGEKRGWKTEGYWTYDYMCVKQVDENGKVDKKRLPSSLPKLRGRKFYWHSDNCKPKNMGNRLDHKMKQRIRPIAQDGSHGREKKFCFRVYFDRLNQEELERLRWALDFADSDCAHKIGRGKPLGFGSARIRIKGMKIREFNPDTGEWRLADRRFDNLGKNIAINSEAIKTLKLMANAKKGHYPEDVSYPRLLDGSQGEESFRWFANNRRNQDSKGMQPAFTKILPKAVEEFGPEKRQERRLDTGTPK